MLRYAVKQDKQDDKEHLTFYEKNIAVIDNKIGLDNPDESDFSELLSGMKSIVFEYLKKPAR